MSREYAELMDNFEFSKAFDLAWEKVQDLNRRIDETKPWELAKNGETEALENVLGGLVTDLKAAAVLISPFLPATAAKILQIFADQKSVVVPKTPLFPKN